MKTKKIIKWLKNPEAHNYPAAHSYLSLIYEETKVVEFVNKLKAATVKKFKAKDIFRSANVSLLGVSNLHVEKDRKKIKKGIPLSPILLVRDSLNSKLIIADGYHRLCAIYSFDEDAIIFCKII
jgi:hypothetical protein